MAVTDLREPWVSYPVRELLGLHSENRGKGDLLNGEGHPAGGPPGLWLE